MNPTDFIENLISRVVVLRTLYQEHLQDYGEVLPYVFMGRVASFVAESVLASGNAAAVEAVLDSVDHALQDCSSALHDVIWLSFIEPLWSHPQAWRVCYAKAGPFLRKEMDAYASS